MKPHQTLELILAMETDDCIPWPHGRRQNGYGRINGNQRVHRLVCLLVHGPPPTPEHNQAAHSCNNPPCCNSRHLRWATNAENQEDRINSGRGNDGARNGQSKLTDDQVLEIRRRYADGALQRILAEEFGVTQPRISEIVNRNSWCSV